MFQYLVKKLFNHGRQEQLEKILINLNETVIDIKHDFDTAITNSERINELYETKLNNEKLLSSVYDVSMTLFQNNDLDKSLLETLKIISSRGNCQKAFIFKNIFTETTSFSERTFEWYDTNIKDVKESNYSLIDWNEFPHWKNKIINNLFICGAKDNFKRNSTKQVLDKLGIESILILPIFVNSVWWGSLILGTIYPKEWNQSEINVLISLCNIMGTAIRRNELYQNSKICQHGSINFLREIASNIDGSAFWMKDINNKYVFADNALIELVYPTKQLPDIIGKTDCQITSNINISLIDLTDISEPSDLSNIDLSEYNDVKICNITDQITQHFKLECNFFEKINDRYYDILKVPLLRQKTRSNDDDNDSDIDNFILTGTAGALTDVTHIKDKKLKKLKKLISTGLAFQIGNTENYYVRTKLFPNYF